MNTRLFAGCLLTAEMKLHLSKSAQWRDRTLEKGHLIETHFASKDYVGRYLDKEKLTLHDLRDLQTKIQELIGECSLELAGRHFELKVFPQTMIG